MSRVPTTPPTDTLRGEIAPIRVERAKKRCIRASVRAVTLAPTTPTQRRPSRSSGDGIDDTWRVIVMNDNHNTFDGVAFALASVLPGVSFERAMEFANRIHSAGRAIVWSGHREAAELYWSRLEELGLTMAPLGS